MLTLNSPFGILLLSSFLTDTLSSKVNCGMPFHDFTYPPVIRKTSPFFILKSCQDVNCALPVSSARTPENTFFVSPLISASRSFTSSILAVISTAPIPDRKSFTFTSLGSNALSGSLLLSVFSIFTRSPKFSCTDPCHSLVYAFEISTTSPLSTSRSLLHDVKEIVPLSSPKIP